MGKADFKTARTVIDGALKEDPHAYEALFASARLLLREGRLQEAGARWDDVIRAHPEKALPRVHLAYTLVQIGRLSEALQVCQEARRLDPGNLEALQFLRQFRP